MFRQVINEVVPLGIGLTESPAADVAGVAVKSEKEEDPNDDETEGNTPERPENGSQKLPGGLLFADLPPGPLSERSRAPFGSFWDGFGMAFR